LFSSFSVPFRDAATHDKLSREKPALARPFGIPYPRKEKLSGGRANEPARLSYRRERGMHVGGGGYVVHADDRNVATRLDARFA
jgi:hypothetical protein